MASSIIITSALTIAAPFYNMILAIIVILLFLKFLKTKTQLYKKPWRLLFIAILVFVVETIVVILELATGEAHFIVGIFEMAIIFLFIYMVLLQKDYVKKSLESI